MKRKSRLTEPVPLTDDPLWYKDAIIYELHVRAFADSNDDGIGDLRGLIDKLDYLQDLGVSAIWLLPFYPSPLRDDGYDIANYTDVHPAYGCLDDFKELLDQAHSRGLRVITELVINHTSDQHPWFQRARRAKPGSPERDYYVWSDTPDRYRDARIIFKDFETSNWTWDPLAGAYYWHRFYSHQPDLNYDNPAVCKAAIDSLDFWLNLGVDGLRLDAIPYIYEREGTNCENLPETHIFLRELRRHVDAKFQDRMLLAEANQWPEDAVSYFGQGDECHMAFHFPVMPRLFMAIHTEDRFPITDILQQTPAIPENCQWAMFLRNHDELTLEMVTDEDRDYMWRIYAQDPQARINLGIRRRLAPLLENHRGKIELMNGLLFSLPGTPVLYYGDEIGMGDNIYVGDRHGVRTPMQWNGERNAGFSRANPQRLYVPLIIDPAYHFERINVEAQQNHPHSLLWWMKRLIALRKRYQAFGRGSLEFVPSENPKVLAFVRCYQDECLLVVANLSRLVQYTELDLSAFRGQVPVELMGRTQFPAIGPQPYFLTLGGYGFFWFSLEREKVPIAAPAPEAELRTLEVTGRWESVFASPGKEQLERTLTAYLPRCSWFQGTERSIDSATIQETVPIPNSAGVAHVALVEVVYTEGDPESYVLPVAFAAGERADDVCKQLPQGIVCRLLVKDRRTEGGGMPRSGVLYDPLGEEHFTRTLAEAVEGQQTFDGDEGRLLARAFPQDALFAEGALAAMPPALLRGPQSNSSVVFGDRMLLKLFRRLEEGAHPEVEIGRFLEEKTTFHHTPPVVGTLEYRRNGVEPVTIAVLQGWVPNEGDAWHFTLSALGRFYEQALTTQAKPDLSTPRRALFELAEREVPSIAREHLGSFREMIRLLGQRTAEMHLALASGEEPAFAPEPFTPFYQRSLYQSFRAQARRALTLLRRRLKELPDSLREEAQHLVEQEEALLKRGRAIFEQTITAQRIRVHGDYHLAQVLYTGKDYVIIDFEGQSGTSLSDRRRKRSPLRDVASMLRSFHFAAHAALEGGRLRTEDIATLEPWARFWQRWTSVVFVKAYRETVGEASFLPADRAARVTLLEFYLLKRAANELRLELLHRTGRVRVPVQGLLQLLETSA
jgi:maltose alpha-D-glucosyltransferase/alpha-amylase